MANLKTIFEEDGIAGVIPYAFSPEEPGYQFLCGKLKEPVPFYILVCPFPAEGSEYFVQYPLVYPCILK